MTAYDKMKWHSDAEDFPQQLPTNQGAVHIAFFYRWMLEHQLANTTIIEEDDPELYEQLMQGQITALDFFIEFYDGVLLDEDLTEEGVAFASTYYDAYLTDYENLPLQLFDGYDSRYAAIYNEENYVLVARLLEGKFKAFLK